MKGMRAVVLSVAVLQVLARPLPAFAESTPERLMGLLALPQLFGNGPCDRFKPYPLALYASRDSSIAMGEIRVDTPWTFHQAGGCEGLQVGAHLFGADGAGAALPTREYGYEEPGAVVLARSGGRYKIALAVGSAWVEPRAGAEFHPMATLLAERLSYLTDAWSGMACDVPAQPQTCREVDAGGEREPGVTVLGHRDVAGELWFQIELPARESCGEPVPPIPSTRGWVSGHDNRGEPAIWFHSRGC